MGLPRITTAALGGALLLLGSPAAWCQDDPLEELAQSPLEGSIRREDVRSPALRRKARYTLYLPPGYLTDTDRRYPLVLLLHDLFENEERWISRGGPQIVDQGIKSGTLPPAVVAVPEGKKGFWTDPAPGASGRRWRTFLTDDLMPHLDKQVRLVPGREGRVVFGLGMGGWGALSMAFERPALFAAAGARDPLLPATDPATFGAPTRKLLDHLFVHGAIADVFGDPVAVPWWRRHHPEVLAGSLDPACGLRILVETGASSPFEEGARRLHEKLDQTGVPHQYHVRSGASGWEGLRESLGASLGFLLGKGGPPQPAAGGKPSVPHPQPPGKDHQRIP